MMHSLNESNPKIVEYVRRGTLTEKHVEQLIFISIGEHFQEWLNLDEIRYGAGRLGRHTCRGYKETIEEITEYHSYDLQTTYAILLKDIRARQRGTRDNLIIKLSLLGWSQEKIAEKVGLDQSVVSRIVQNGNFAEMHNFHHKKQTVLRALRRSISTAYSIGLEGYKGLPRRERLMICLDLTEKN